MSRFYTCVQKITIIWCMLLKIWNLTDIIFCHLGHFLPFSPLLTQKIKFGMNVKKAADIILLYMCTINEDHIMYGSWDIRHSKQSFLSFWTIFWPLTLLTTWKIKVLKKCKTCLKILSFYISIPQMMIICMVPEIWSVTEFFLILDQFLSFNPPF